MEGERYSSYLSFLNPFMIKKSCYSDSALMFCLFELVETPLSHDILLQSLQLQPIILSLLLFLNNNKYILVYRRLENDAATKRLRLAMEMDEERKARLEKMVTTTQLRLALETEKERRARLESVR